MKIEIRDVCESDFPFIYQWENDEDNWEVSETTRPYTQEEIVALCASAENFHETYQKRWMIVREEDGNTIGTLDVFKGEYPNGEVGIGILVADKRNRNQGIGKKAIEKAIEICQINYNLHTFHAHIHQKNIASIQLFKKCGFELSNYEKDNYNFDTNVYQIVHLILCVKK